MKIKMLSLLLLLINISVACAFENYEQAYNQMRQRYGLGHYKRVIAIAPVALNFSKTPQQKFDVLYFKGLALDSLQRFWQAEQIFKEAASLEGISDKHKTQAYYNLIRSQYSNQHFLSALTNVEKYANFSGQLSIPQLNILLLGIEAAKQLNKPTKALVYTEKMINNTAPDSAWHFRGIIARMQILCMMNNYKKAEKIVKQTKIDNIPHQMRAEFLTWSGYCYEKENNLKVAEKYYSTAYNEYANYYSGLAALRHANLLNRSGKNLNLAAEKYEKVLKMSRAHPKHKSQAIYKIASIYNQKKKPDTAIRYLAQVDDLKSPSVFWQGKIYNLHGEILYQKGKIQMAQKYFYACLDLSEPVPAFKLYAEEILAQLEEETFLPEKQ
jgi:tetratricopeptide (TPR) repeat protein